MLAEAGYVFEEIAADGNPALRAELFQRSGQSTLPQIFVGDESVGGYRELTLMLSNGRFAQLLERDWLTLRGQRHQMMRYHKVKVSAPAIFEDRDLLRIPDPPVVSGT